MNPTSNKKDFDDLSTSLKDWHTHTLKNIVHQNNN